jgi:hypothetical protein
VAHAITGRAWIAWATVMILLAGMTGAVPFLLFNPHGIDFSIATDMNESWSDKDRNPFWWICAHDQYHPALKLLPPIYTLYYSEFHANLGGVFITMLALFASLEVFKPESHDGAWTALVVLPMLVLITSAWFFFIVLILCAGSGALALLAGRRPHRALVVGLGAVIGLVLLWPSVLSILQNPSTQNLRWTHADERTPLWMFALQWWPVYLPWFLLCFVWDRLDLRGRWMHFILPVLLLVVEFATFGDRGLTIEKMWGALFGAGLVTLLPYLFIQVGLFYRLVTIFFVLIHFACLAGWTKDVYYDPLDPKHYFHIEGNFYMQEDSQLKRMLQALRPLHGATILPGKSFWAYNEAPGLVTFSENRCFVAYFHQEDQAGHGGEAQYRSGLNNEFYRGKMTDPLPFLRTYDIAAVLIWPDDKISDDLLQTFQAEIGSEYFYINCKGDGPNNAGVFLRQTATPVPAAVPSPGTLDLGPPPSPDGDAP